MSAGDRGRARTLLLGLLCAAAVPAGALAAAAPSYPVEVLRDSGAQDKRIDIAVLGDGYRQEDQAQLSSDARTLVDRLFADAPFRDYAGLFNVRLVHVVSQDRGAGNGSVAKTVNTALSAHFGCNGIDRLLCVDTEQTARIAAQNVPAYDVLVVLVNDPKYGGSGGQVATLSTASAAADILRHELGHTLGHLADEYSTPYPGYPACQESADGDCPEPNATLVTDRAKLKWASWVDAQTPVPTSSAATQAEVGEFEGCRYQDRGIYRPVADGCLMRRLSDASGQSEHLCPVCTQAMVRAFWSQAAMVDAFSPASVTPEVTPCGPVTFSVTTAPILQPRMLYLWSVDGEPKQIDATRFAVSAAELTPGHHTVTALVEDRTPLVRDDPGGGAMQQVQTWEIHVQDGAAGSCQPGPCEQTAACSEGQCVTTLKPEGTACGPASCEAGVETPVRACNAVGACVPVQQPESCGLFTCDGAGHQCRGYCSEDGDCASGARCAQGACVPEDQPVPTQRGCQSVPGIGSAITLLSVLCAARLRRRAR